jgi:RNA polymerase sigma factor (sigma-70 family)
MLEIRREPDLTLLLERCKRSDAGAWSTLIDRFQALVYSVPKRMGLDEDDAGDVFQTTFQALLRSLDRIENADTLPKWLAVTASRESLRLKRVKGKTLLPDGIDLEEIVATEERSAEEMAVAESDALEVRRAVKRLSGRCRELLERLYFSDEGSYQQISEGMGLAIGAIGPTRARCLEKVRKSLEDSGLFR